MQKVMIKGLAKDEMTLRQVGVVKGSKVMVVGSTITDVLEVNKKPSAQQLKEEEKEELAKEAWSEQKVHKKVLEKGKPEDAMPGLKGVKESLPPVPLSGMLNKSGGKVRLTFKMIFPTAVGFSAFPYLFNNLLFPIQDCSLIHMVGAIFVYPARPHVFLVGDC